MTQTSRQPFPPAPLAKIAGSVIRPLPLAPLQPALDMALLVMRRRHPSIFERLAELGEASFVVDPVDLPAVFLFQPGCQPPSLKIARDDTQLGPRIKVAAAIRGPLIKLIDLLEGRLDGDALFFSRELNIEGDTEAVLLLRNAIDSEEVDVLGDILSVLGPLAEPARNAADNVLNVILHLAMDLENLLTAVAPPSSAKDGAER